MSEIEIEWFYSIKNDKEYIMDGNKWRIFQDVALVCFRLLSSNVIHSNTSQNARHMILSLIAVRVVVVVVSTSQCCKNFLNAKRKWNCILNATCRLNFYYISWGSSWSVNTHATKYKKKGLCVTIFFVRTIM